MTDDPIRVTFGQLEAALSAMHAIADDKRTAFQSRLKNFHRFAFPALFAATKGKTSYYSAGQALDMALALEMTQLGLPPERVVRVLIANWFPTYMATRMAARALLERPLGFDVSEVRPDDPLSMFVFFDPVALSPLTDNDRGALPFDGAEETFFYGGEAVVKENLVKWTSGGTSRLSIINMTFLIDYLSEVLAPKGGMKAWRDRFFRDVIWWAEERDIGFDEGGAAFLTSYFLTAMRDPTAEIEAEALIDLAERWFDLPKHIAEKAIKELKSIQEGIDVDQEA